MRHIITRQVTQEPTCLATCVPHGKLLSARPRPLAASHVPGAAPGASQLRTANAASTSGSHSANARSRLNWRSAQRKGMFAATALSYGDVLTRASAVLLCLITAAAHCYGASPGCCRAVATTPPVRKARKRRRRTLRTPEPPCGPSSGCPRDVSVPSWPPTDPRLASALMVSSLPLPVRPWRRARTDCFKCSISIALAFTDE